MKRIFKTFSSSLLALVTALSLSTTALAADSTVTFQGQNTGFSFKPGSEYTATDLFDNFKNVMPGDKLTETIQIKNEASDCDYVNFYMRAQIHDENGNPLTYSESFEKADGKDQTGIDGQRDETVVTMQDFLSKLSMKVYNGMNLIYEASPDELDGLKDNVLLGTLRREDTVNLTVELALPIELGNEYANRVGEVDWIFLVEALDDPEPEESEPAVTPEPKQPPKTGDTSNLSLYIVLAGGAGIALIFLLVFRRRKESEDN